MFLLVKKKFPKWTKKAINFKNLYAVKCNGSVINDAEYGMIISLQGDHRQGVVDFLVSEEIVPKEMIVVHGF